MMPRILISSHVFFLAAADRGGFSAAVMKTRFRVSETLFSMIGGCKPKGATGARWKVRLHLVGSPRRRAGGLRTSSATLALTYIRLKRTLCILGGDRRPPLALGALDNTRSEGLLGPSKQNEKPIPRATSRGLRPAWV